jgi:glycosyltransferase involved in cell wall biosynthesis
MTVVSVILPTYDRPAYVRAAVDSVVRQTHADWELIIADDGSGEETQCYLRGLTDSRMSVIRLAHTGNPSRVRNAAIQRARGEYIAFLDSDDLWEPSKTEVQLATLRSSPGSRWSYTAATDIDSDGRPIEFAGQVPWLPLAGNIVEPLITIRALLATSAVMAERSLVAELGGFDESQLFGEDYDLWLRMATRSNVAVVDRPLTRVRNGQITSYGGDRIGAYEGWVQWYDKLTRSLSDGRLRVLAGQRRSESTLVLAGLYAEAGRRGAAWRTLAYGARRGPTTAGWWWRAVKTMVRSIFP